jgi:hypothetical protein
MHRVLPGCTYGRIPKVQGPLDVHFVSPVPGTAPEKAGVCPVVPMGKLLAIVLVSGCAAAWLSTLYNAVRMTRCIRPPAPGQRDYRNRFNVIFCPSDLTPKGQHYRERALFSMLMFPAVIVAAIILSAALGL